MKRKNFTLTASSAMLILSFPALAVLSDPTDTVKGRVPVITQSTIVSADTNSNGVFDIGDVISISQQGAFSDPDGDAESQRTFQWQADGADISGATSDTYTVTASDLGKKITVLVTPHTDPTITDPDTGIAVASNELSAASASTPIAVQIDGAVNGFPQVDTELSAVVQLADGSAGDAGTYQWKIETAIGSGVYQNIPGANGKTYKPVAGDQKRKLQIEVN
uniref:ZirU family protein n=1 Tax=Citrobacter freundii TaxID=546 RepID=UPI001F5B39A9|nr:ZirU family protein [Citrobacter freundii]